MELKKLFHQTTVSVEDKVDIARRKIWRRTGRNKPEQIVAYRGYADSKEIHLSGRVLSNKLGGGPMDEDGWWDNLVNTYKRWESDEVPHAKVSIDIGGEKIELKANDEGYYSTVLPRRCQGAESLHWKTVGVKARGETDDVHAVHEIMVPPSNAQFGVISDIDDTVIHTGITSLVQAAKLTFLENAKTRKPLDGVAELYKRLQKGNFNLPTNPMFYVSSSPWNLYDLLEDFFELNDIPKGPFFLRDIGVDATKFIKSEGHGHKYDKALKIVDQFPDLPFFLIGDSGQDDPIIYADLVEARPGRIKAIYIRDISPGLADELDSKVEQAKKRLAGTGVPVLRVEDGLEIAKHVSRLGLIPEIAAHAVEDEVEKDRSRPETGEKALSQAAS